MLFAFDLKRRAILLVGGDKSENWTAWYEVNIPIADDRFEEHQAAIKAGAGRYEASGAQADPEPER